MAYVVLGYKAGGLSYAQIVTIDLSDGSYDLNAVPDLGYISDRPMAAPGDGSLYFGTTQILYPHLFGVEPVAGTISQLATGTARDFYRCTVDHNGVCYWGSYGVARLFSYDPATLTFTDYGDLNAGTGQWSYHVAVDPACTHAYVVIGQNPWWLVVVDLSTSAQTHYWADQSMTTCTVQYAVDESALYCNHTSVGGFTWAELSGGVVTPIASGSVPALKDHDFLNLYDDAEENFVANYTLELNLDNAVPDNVSDAQVVFRVGGVGGYTTVDIPGLTIVPQTIRRVVAYDATTMLCSAAAYGPEFLFNPVTSAVTKLGTIPHSVYDMLGASNSEWYVASYPNGFWEYDPLSAWTLTESSSDYSLTNPRLITVGHKYNYWLAEDVTGLIWVGVHHERSGTGGELDWFNPVDDSIGEDYTTFNPWECYGLCACGNYIIYSGLGVGTELGSDAQLFVCEAGAPITVVDTHVPLVGITQGAYLIPVDSSDVIGITTNYAYRIDVLTGTVVWDIALPGPSWNGQAYYDRRAEIVGGKIYVPFGSSLYALDVATGDYSVIYQNVGTKNTMTFNTQVYVYGDTHIRRLDGI